MSFRFLSTSLILATLLLNGSTLAESPEKPNRLSYYSYYKTKSGETVSGLSARFSLSEENLRRMNPQISSSENILTPGSLLFVPRIETPPQASSTNSGLKPSPKKKKKKHVAAKKKRKKRQRKAKDLEEPSLQEWDKIAELATDNAPKVQRPQKKALKVSTPVSRLVRPNGEVVLIPTVQKQKPAPVKKKEKKVEIKSRKGKAIHEVLNTCRRFIGTPYVWGGERPGGFDCSGYIQYVFAEHGYDLPRTADIQFNVCLLYTSPSPRDRTRSRMPSSA